MSHCFILVMRLLATTASVWGAFILGGTGGGSNNPAVDQCTLKNLVDSSKGIKEPGWYPTKESCYKQCRGKGSSCKTYFHDSDGYECYTANYEVSSFSYDAGFSTGFMSCDRAPECKKKKKGGKGGFKVCPATEWSLGPCYVQGLRYTGCNLHAFRTKNGKAFNTLKYPGLNSALKGCRKVCKSGKYKEGCENWHVDTDEHGHFCQMQKGCTGTEKHDQFFSGQVTC